jgi:hypothetical protein
MTPVSNPTPPRSSASAYDVEVGGWRAVLAQLVAAVDTAATLRKRRRVAAALRDVMDRPPPPDVGDPPDLLWARAAVHCGNDRRASQARWYAWASHAYQVTRGLPAADPLRVKAVLAWETALTANAEYQQVEIALRCFYRPCWVPGSGSPGPLPRRW